MSIHVPMIHGTQCGLIYTSSLVKGSQLLRICFQTDNINWGCSWKHSLPPLMGPVKTLKQTWYLHFVFWKSLFPSFSLTDQIVNGVCFFPTAWYFFSPYNCDFRVIIGSLVFNMGQNQKTITSHLDPDTFP